MRMHPRSSTFPALVWCAMLVAACGPTDPTILVPGGAAVVASLTWDKIVGDSALRAAVGFRDAIAVAERFEHDGHSQISRVIAFSKGTWAAETSAVIVVGHFAEKELTRILLESGWVKRGRRQFADSSGRQQLLIQSRRILIVGSGAGIEATSRQARHAEREKLPASVRSRLADDSYATYVVIRSNGGEFFKGDADIGTLVNDPRVRDAWLALTKLGAAKRFEVGLATVGDSVRLYLRAAMASDGVARKTVGMLKSASAVFGLIQQAGITTKSSALSQLGPTLTPTQDHSDVVVQVALPRAR